MVPCINVKTGGPAVSVPGLADALAASGVACSLVTLDYAGLGPQTPVAYCRLDTLPAGPLTRQTRGWSPSLKRLLMRRARHVHLVHNHGLWMLPNSYARQAAIRYGHPLVISPRGMLEEWSLNRSRLRKALSWRLFERANLTAAAGFHATSEAERDSIRALGLRQPIATIPNGVPPAPDPAPPRALLEQALPALRGRRWCLYLGRLHPKKGLDRLLREWASSTRDSDWQLILAGPDLTGYSRAVSGLIDQLGIRESVAMAGMLEGDMKAAALAGAELFVLPSHSENFGVAVAEALMAGTPAITTEGTPWRALAESGCGWWVPQDRIGEALNEALGMTREGLLERGRLGREFAWKHFDWASIASRMLEFYRFLLGRADRQDFIDCDGTAG